MYFPLEVTCWINLILSLSVSIYLSLSLWTTTRTLKKMHFCGKIIKHFAFHIRWWIVAFHREYTQECFPNGNWWGVTGVERKCGDYNGFSGWYILALRDATQLLRVLPQTQLTRMLNISDEGLNGSIKSTWNHFLPHDLFPFLITNSFCFLQLQGSLAWNAFNFREQVEFFSEKASS